MSQPPFPFPILPIEPSFRWERKRLEEMFEYDPKAYPECVQHEKDWFIGKWPRRRKYLLLIHRSGEDLDIRAVYYERGEWRIERIQ